VKHRGLRRAARRADPTGGIEPVLDDVQVKSAQFDDAEVVNLLINIVELVVAIRRHHVILQCERFGDHPLIDGKRAHATAPSARRIEAIHVSQQEPQRVAHAPVGIRHSPQDFLRYAHFVGIVGRRDPQPHHIGAERTGQFLRYEVLPIDFDIFRPISSTVKP